MAMEKGKERWGMIADDIWDMILGKAGRLPGKLAPEIIEKAEREGRKFFDGNPQDNYPDQLEKYRKIMLEKQWDKGQDDEELFEYAMHPASFNMACTLIKSAWPVPHDNGSMEQFRHTFILQGVSRC